MTTSKVTNLTSQGISRRLKVAVCLMSVLPLLVSIYMVTNYVLPHFGFRLDITLSIAISMFIALLGFFLIKDVLDRIITMSTEAKMMAAGDITRRVEVVHSDEIGDLGISLNKLTQRIRSNMDELKTYSEKTTDFNIQIQKRVMVLSGLMQISALISQSAKLEEVFRVIVEKCRHLANSDTAYLLFRQPDQETFYVKAADGIDQDYLIKVKVGPEEDIFDKTIATNRRLIIDKDNIISEELRLAFQDKFKTANALVMPVYLRGRVVALLGVGNSRAHFSYKEDDIGLFDIFAKQTALAIENDILLKRVEKLEIKDALTGLYNEAFIRNRLQEEIRRAITYRRPCAFVLINIDNFRVLYEGFNSLQIESMLKKVALLIKDSVTDIDRVGRFGDNEFAIILPEKNKRQAQELAEEIRKEIESSFGQEQDAGKRLTVSGSVSENPLDGTQAEELINKAKDALGLAKAQGKNRIADINR